MLLFTIFLLPFSRTVWNFLAVTPGLVCPRINRSLILALSECYLSEA